MTERRPRPGTTRSIDSVSRFKPTFLAGTTKPGRSRNKQQFGTTGNDAPAAPKDIDMGKILTESWLLEKNNLERLEIQQLAPDFNEPTRQVELLERTSAELNRIQTRVAKTLLDFEQVNNADDVLNIIDPDDDDDAMHLSAGLDRKSLMEESKGKVKVLLVDYGKLGLKRETVLSALKEWFDEMENDSMADLTDTLDDDEHVKNFGDKTVNALLTSAHSAKDRLIDLHYDLVEYCQSQIKALAAAAQAVQESRNSEHQRDMIDKVTNDLEEMVGKVKEYESRTMALEKQLERKDDELKFFRVTDNSKLSQLKDELFQYQMQATERENELNKELVRTKLSLDKAHQQLELWANNETHSDLGGSVSMAPPPLDDDQLDVASMDADDWMELHLRDKARRRRLESQVRRLQQEVKAQAAISDKELAVMRSQHEEEFQARLHKARLEARNELDNVKSSQAQALRQREQEVQERSDEELAKKFDGLGGAGGSDKDAKKMWDALRKTYEDRLAFYKETGQLELQRARQEHEARLQAANADLDRRIELLGETHSAEMDRQRTELAATAEQAMAEQAEAHEQAMLAAELSAHQAAAKLRRTLGAELSGLQQDVQRREQLVRDIMAKVELLNSMVSRIDDGAGAEDSASKAAGQAGGTREEEFKKLRADFLLEKKKAVQVALHQAALERDAAVIALERKQRDELNTLVDERTRQVLDENARELEYKDEQVKSLERELALMRDELEQLNSELDKEDDVRESLFRKAREELQQERDKYERIIADLIHQSSPSASASDSDGGVGGFELVDGETAASAALPGEPGGDDSAGPPGTQLRKLQQRVAELQADNDFLRTQAIVRHP
eukprot:TRINITY_DN5714_c1_g1_i4.p1 TRINITY_DN5714_c1_g1~~TRINITY_DN5714_c1_g1_i4.p1  ORF type:complete len:849 (-),score=452.96 TRINITY_DN5714_c1_g1_i4:298-2844(-)